MREELSLVLRSPSCLSVGQVVMKVMKSHPHLAAPSGTLRSASSTAPSSPQPPCRSGCTAAHRTTQSGPRRRRRSHILYTAFHNKRHEMQPADIKKSFHPTERYIRVVTETTFSISRSSIPSRSRSPPSERSSVKTPKTILTVSHLV